MKDDLEDIEFKKKKLTELYKIHGDKWNNAKYSEATNLRKEQVRSALVKLKNDIGLYRKKELQSLEEENRIKDIVIFEVTRRGGSLENARRIVKETIHRKYSSLLKLILEDDVQQRLKQLHLKFEIKPQVQIQLCDQLQLESMQRYCVARLFGKRIIYVGYQQVIVGPLLQPKCFQKQQTPKFAYYTVNILSAFSSNGAVYSITTLQELSIDLLNEFFDQIEEKLCSAMEFLWFTNSPLIGSYLDQIYDESDYLLNGLHPFNFIHYFLSGIGGVIEQCQVQDFCECSCTVQDVVQQLIGRIDYQEVREAITGVERECFGDVE